MMLNVLAALVGGGDCHDIPGEITRGSVRYGLHDNNGRLYSTSGLYCKPCGKKMDERTH